MHYIESNDSLYHFFFLFYVTFAKTHRRNVMHFDKAIQFMRCIQLITVCQLALWRINRIFVLLFYFFFQSLFILFFICLFVCLLSSSHIVFIHRFDRFVGMHFFPQKQHPSNWSFWCRWLKECRINEENKNWIWCAIRKQKNVDVMRLHFHFENGIVKIYDVRSI